MSTGPNRILDEFAKLMTDAAGAAQGVRREVETAFKGQAERILNTCLLYTSPSPRDGLLSRMPSSA